MRTLLWLPAGILGTLDQILLAQRGHLFPWAPVIFAAGIAAYFACPVEPRWPVHALAAAAGVVAAAIAWRRPGGWSALAWAVALAASGFGLAGLRAASVAAPVLSWHYYGAVEGRVVGLDRSASDAVRITLDRVRLERISPARVPERVRLSLHGPPADPQPGERVMTTARLSPPQGPVEPGGFDFRRHAWFQRLGAVGYTRAPLLTVAPAEGVRLTALRIAIASHIRAALPGEVGAFAAAVTTGDRSGVTQETLADLRASNLAHLLAISGLHMGLLAGFVFGAVRFALAAVPYVALRWPLRALSAGAALVAATGYLALSGGNVATERAYVMAAVALFAVMVNRRALSLRAVALAAMVVLALRPEALLGPGFQMSFAATTALVAVFGALRGIELPRLPRWLRPVMAVVISSTVAGLATAPVGAAHFNTLSHYGLIANLISVPVMGLVVVPAAVLAACLAPLGLEQVGLWIMGRGLAWILGVSDRVAALDGAVGQVVSPGPWVLPLLALGGLWLVLWQGRARVAGLVPMVIGAWLWAGVTRPPVLVADSGGLVGVMEAQGRALSRARGDGFVARVWLENDGDAATQQEAAARWPGQEGRLRRIVFAGREIVHVAGKRAAAELTDCREGQLVIASVPVDLTGPCEVYDVPRLRETGSLAIWPGRVVTARAVSGARRWSPAPRRKRQ